ALSRRGARCAFQRRTHKRKELKAVVRQRRFDAKARRLQVHSARSRHSVILLFIAHRLAVSGQLNSPTSSAATFRALGCLFSKEFTGLWRHLLAARRM